MRLTLDAAFGQETYSSILAREGLLLLGASTLQVHFARSGGLVILVNLNTRSTGAASHGRVT